jgi:hypothetical protein
VKIEEPVKIEDPVKADIVEDRPVAERFYTAGPGTGAGLFSSGTKPDERPGVERFETAQEDLNLLARKA